MAMRRTEVPNSTPEQVRGYVREALAVAADCGLDDDERVALLPHIFDQLAGKQIVLEEVGPGLGLTFPNGMG